MIRFSFLLLVLLTVLTGCRQEPEKSSAPPEPEPEHIDEGAESTEPGMAYLYGQTDEIDIGFRNFFTTFGRTTTAADGSIELISPASAVRFQARGGALHIRMRTPGNDHAYVLVTVNGEPENKYKIKGKGLTAVEVGFEDENTWYEIGIHKLTEAHNGAIVFIDADAQQIKESVYKKDLQIEFIGNSITCGYGADTADIPCGTDVNYDQHNAWKGYAVQVANSIDADYNLSAISGIGIYRNYRADRKEVMPDVYGNLYLDEGRRARWNQEGWDPDIVSVCLGTNDFSKGSDPENRAPFDPEKFTAAYIRFLEELDRRYPDAAFGLLTSPMLDAEQNRILSDCLFRVKDHFGSSEVIEVFEFRDRYISGCAGHPDLKEHELMAQQLQPFYRSLLNNREGMPGEG
ncbi:hypothetical protein E7Z59_05875 [Robertkochia marina]|uniref:GDSL family lipase n=1 Tax=Robertkochia marina TaxID=1227945 RepID=A0A4S3M3U8_9FLAO|nr:SGNH/GDSL hydrolase family protein [Robertkochia marina]THD69854.1 hypothetical protein E7Z59_05875 [Robertkochia marina]TRZ46801.1 hypothetical protein D3A96_04335 [Robertkochia marina]